MNSADEHWFAKNFRSAAQLSLAYGVGLDPGKWPRSPNTWPQASLRLLWVGSFTTRKNPDAFVELIRALTCSGFTIDATMLGEGPLYSEVRKQAHGLPISFPGQQHPLVFLQDSHGLVLTSSWEGLPRVGLEACAVGRPVFGFDVKGVRDLPNAFVTDPQGGAPGLAKVVGDWVRDPLVDYPDRRELAFQRPAQAVLDLIKETLRS
jgi:glycosyltransferase involved in cell wall biosynthesis